MTDILNHGSHEYHTPNLPGNKALRTVLRDIPNFLSTENINHNLMEVGIDMITATNAH